MIIGEEGLDGDKSRILDGDKSGILLGRYPWSYNSRKKMHVVLRRESAYRTKRRKAQRWCACNKMYK